MRHKESAIAVMIAVMLGAASLFGGFSTLPALAVDDPDAKQVIRTQIDNDETMAVGAIELTAEKSTLSTKGTLTIEVIQGEVLASATVKTSQLGTSPTTLEVELDKSVNIEGAFEILVEFVGVGKALVSEISVSDGTETAGNPDENSENTDTPDDGPTQTQQVELENVILTKTISQGSDKKTMIEIVEFTAEKSTLRTNGILAVAIVQANEPLETKAIKVSELSTNPTDREVDFGGLEVTGNYQVAFMHEGMGKVIVTNINVPGDTSPAEQPPSQPNPDGTFQLVVNAVDQNNNKLEGLHVALLNGQNQFVAEGFTEDDATFTLDADKSYIVEMGNWYNKDTQTSYEFEKWQDSTTDSTRRSADPAQFGDDNKETFTAEYTVTENAPPPVDDGNDDVTASPPPDSPPGTISVYAYRIPSGFWGPTFASANATMYFVVYNSVGEIIETGYADETGTTIDGLNEGETYWINPTDCHHCHGGTHDVRFHHWDDASTERQRPVTTGMSAGAYYEYVPDTP